MTQFQENAQTDRRTEGQTEGWTEGRKDGRTDPFYRTLPATAGGPIKSLQYFFNT